MLICFHIVFLYFHNLNLQYLCAGLVWREYGELYKNPERYTRRNITGKQGETPPKNVSFVDLDSLFISDLTFQNVQIFVSAKKFFLVSKKSKLCHIYSMFEKEC